MTIQTFNFPHHRASIQYPEDQFRASFGRGWTFAAGPTGKPQRVIRLNFEGMQYFTNDSLINATTNPYGVDATVNATRNMRAMELFYKEHRTHKEFYYFHPVEGRMLVRFNKPLEIPEVEKGGYGVVSSFQIEFLEQPT